VAVTVLTAVGPMHKTRLAYLYQDATREPFESGGNKGCSFQIGISGIDSGDTRLRLLSANVLGRFTKFGSAAAALVSQEAGRKPIRGEGGCYYHSTVLQEITSD
jgi:hypothetical protein